MSTLAPKRITVDRKKDQLTIKWNDGHVSIYPFALLREACPCAECQGGHENMRSEPDPDVFLIPLENSRKTKISDVEGVGNYGIKITWADGHSYGIYNWHYLKALCPCEMCQP